MCAVCDYYRLAVQHLQAARPHYLREAAQYRVGPDLDTAFAKRTYSGESHRRVQLLVAPKQG